MRINIRFCGGLDGVAFLQENVLIASGLLSYHRRTTYYHIIRIKCPPGSLTTYERNSDYYASGS